MSRRERALIAAMDNGEPKVAPPLIVMSLTSIALATSLAEVHELALTDLRVSALFSHAMELGLALLAQSYDDPATFLEAYDGALDLIDELRVAQGKLPLGEAGPPPISATQTLPEEDDGE